MCAHEVESVLIIFESMSRYVSERLNVWYIHLFYHKNSPNVGTIDQHHWVSWVYLQSMVFGKKTSVTPEFLRCAKKLDFLRLDCPISFCLRPCPSRIGREIPGWEISDSWGSDFFFRSLRRVSSRMGQGEQPKMVGLWWDGIGLEVDPKQSMYGIFTYIWLIFMVNVGKYFYHTWILWGFQVGKKNFLKGNLPRQLVARKVMGFSEAKGCETLVCLGCCLPTSHFDHASEAVKKIILHPRIPNCC